MATKPIPTHYRGPSLSINPASNSNSSSTGTAALQQRITDKRAELASLRELQRMSAAVADQMQMLEDKLSTLANGTEAVATVLANWGSVLRSIKLASAHIPIPKETEGDEKEKEKETEKEKGLPHTLVRIPTQQATALGAQSTSGSTFITDLESNR